MKRSKLSLVGLLLSLSLFGCVTESAKKPAVQNQPELTLSARAIEKDPANGLVSLHGHARIQQGLRVLTAEHIEIDKRSGIVFASENCIYQNGKAVKRSSLMKFKLKDGEWIEAAPSQLGIDSKKAVSANKKLDSASVSK